MKKHGAFSTVTTEGGLLPSGLLKDITSSKTDLSGAKPADYHLGVGERINEAVSRSYSRLANAWKGFQKGLTELPETELGTTITRERWLLILFQELGYGRLMTSSAIEIEGKSYPISHFWHKSPIHLVGARVNLDRRTAKAAGAARTSPHSLVQEFLNRSEECLWGFVANGLTLRILRDNASLTRQSYVEFDLAAMMEGEVYADFALLWMLCHQSRVEAENIHDCWLEQWAKQAQDQGSRALEKLREGVENAISFLGTGFLAPPANKELKNSLRSGDLSRQDYYRQLLRLVYRFLFLFVAEDRNLLLSPKADNATREIYQRFYSMSRLRNMAGKRKGTRHADLYEGIKQVMGRLADDNGCPELGLACLGGFLWSNESIPHLIESRIMNQDLLNAVRALAFFVDNNILTPVDYKNLGSEELGSIYESLLELHVEANADSATFTLQTVGGNERKTTGSYYTHPSLVQCLLDSALESVIAEAIKKPNPEKAILSLKICDPACGSGHFLVAASHRMAKRLAMVRTGDEEPAPEEVRTALRDVIGHSIYGVDINPMAVELCKVSLWMEALEPGKPLSFLDHRILCGNSLLGTTPALIRDGIPNEAFKPIEGDDKELCKALKKRNKEERTGQKSLFGPSEVAWHGLGDCHVVMTHVDAIEDSTPKGIHEKEEQYKRCVTSEGFQHAKLVADTWCAVFVWEKSERPDLPKPITHDLFKALENNPQVLPEPMVREVHRLAEENAFFHWHLAFPDVFTIPEKDEEPENVQTGWSGGFDCILGNPPWEKIQVEEKEFFASRDKHIAKSGAKVRKRLISELINSNPTLFKEWLDHKKVIAHIDSLLKNTSRFPLTGKGKLNTYSLFAELASQVSDVKGKTGCVLPLGLITDKGSSLFFGSLIKNKRLSKIIGFENESFIFPAVHHSFKFCLIVFSGNLSIENDTELVFFCRSTNDAKDHNRSYRLSSDEILKLNPNTLTCPVFRNTREAEIVRQVYRKFDIISNDSGNNKWDVIIKRILNSTDDVELFNLIKADQERMHYIHKDDSTILEPIYEAKMFHQYDHRFGTYVGQTEAQANQGKLPELSNEQHANSNYYAQPRWWIKNEIGEKRTRSLFQHKWILVFRDITSPVVIRTAIAAILPHYCTTETCRCVFIKNDPVIKYAITFISVFNSFIFDFVSRTKFSGNHLSTFIVKQLPMVSPNDVSELCGKIFPNNCWFDLSVLELTYTAWDLEPFSEDYGCYNPPFIWNAERRFLISCELDAALFHLLGIQREDVAYIMETFPIVKRKDEQVHGHFRTKDTILEIYDEMAMVIATNQTALAEGREPNTFFQTRLDPPPGPPCDENGDFIPVEQWDSNNWPPHIHKPKDWDVKAEPTPVAVPYHENPQIFPWKGREQFVRDLIPHLVKNRPGLPFETYRTAAVMASRPEKLRDLLSEEAAAQMDALSRQTLEACTFPDSHHFRPRDVRISLEERKQWIIIDPQSGAATVSHDKKIPELSKNIEPLVPFVLIAAEELHRMKQEATERAKAILDNIDVFESTLAA